MRDFFTEAADEFGRCDPNDPTSGAAMAELPLAQAGCMLTNTAVKLFYIYFCEQNCMVRDEGLFIVPNSVFDQHFGTPDRPALLVEADGWIPMARAVHAGIIPRPLSTYECLAHGPRTFDSSRFRFTMLTPLINSNRYPKADTPADVRASLDHPEVQQKMIAEHARVNATYLKWKAIRSKN